jgi:outer membrane protein assembly complex protein YaeT
MRFLGKAFRKVIWTVVCLIILALVLHTPPVRSLLRGVLVRFAKRQVSGQIAVGRLNYKLWRGSAELREVDLKLPGLHLQADRIKVAFFSKRGLSLQVDSVHVTLSPEPETAAKKQSGQESSYPWSFLNKLGTARIADGLLEWQQGPSRRTVSGSVMLERRNDEQGTDERDWSFSSRLSYQVAGLSPVPLETEGVLGLEGKSLRLETVQLSSDENSLTASGVFRQANPLEGNIRGEFRADTSLAESLGLDSPVKGPMTGQFQLETVDSELRGQVDLASPSFTIAGTGPWATDGTVRLQEKTVLIETLTLRGYGVSIASQGSLDIARGNMKIRLRASGIDLNSLAATWTGGIPPLAARAGAEVELSLENWQFARAKGNGELRFEEEPESGLPLSGKVNVELKNGRLHILSEGLKIAEGSADLKATLDTIGIDAEYGLKFPASGLQGMLSAYRPGLPRPRWEGFLSASGRITGAYTDLSATASVESEEMTFQSQKVGLSAEMEWGRAGLLVHSAQISSGPGNLKIQGALPLMRPTGQWELSGAMESFDLSALVARFGLAILADGSLHIAGPARAPVWTARLKAALEDRKRSPQRTNVSLEAHGQKETISIDELKAEIGGGSLVASGSYRLDSKEMSGRVSGFGIRIQDVAGVPEGMKKIEGVLSLDGDLSGKREALQGRLGLELDGLSINGSPLPKQLFRIRFGDGQTLLEGLGPQAFLTGSCRLHRPYPVQVKVDLSALPHAALLAAFADLPELQITSASGGIHLDFSLEDLSSLRYRADIDGIKGSFQKQVWTIAPFSIEGDRASLRLNGLRYQGAYSSLTVDGTIPLRKDGGIELRIDGRVGTRLLAIAFPSLETGGFAELGLRIQGTPGRPVFEGAFSITQGSGRFRGIPWENLELLARADKGRVRLETLSLQILGGEVKANGNFSLSPKDRGGQVAIEWARLDLGSLLSSGPGLSRPSIRLSGNGRLSIAEFKMSSLSGKGEITEIITSIGNPPISLQRAVEWTFDKGSFSHSPLQMAGEKTDLNVLLKTSVTGPRPEFNVRINGNFNAAALGELIPGSKVSFSDMTSIHLDLEQKAGALVGRASLDGGRIRLSNPPLSISQIQAQLTFDGRTLEIASLKGKISSGSIEASGRLQFEDLGSSPRADIQFTLADVPLIPAEGIFSLVSGQLKLQGETQHYTIAGDIAVPRFLFRREMDEASESLSLIDRQLKILEGRSSLTDQIALDIKVQVRDFRAENRLAQLSAEGVLSVTGTLSRPELGGSITLDEGGSLNLGRARIEISEGRVVLDNYPEGPIELDVGGITRVGGVYIELRVRGPLNNLQTQLQAPYRSDLTQGDLVMLMMTGRTSQAAVSEAGTVAAENLAGALGDMLQKGVGEGVYVDVSSDQSFFSYDTDPTTWFSLGKEVLSNIYVIYATDLGGTRRRAVLGYLPKELPVRLRLVTEEDGRKMLEVNHRLEFGLRAGQNQTGERPGRERVGRVSFKGKSPLDDARLRKLVKLKPGKKYDAWAVQKDADRIQKELEKHDFRNARVEPETTPSGKGRRDVTFLVDSGKRVRFVWKGDEIGKRTRKDIEALWNAAVSEDMLSETVAKKAEYALRADRYYLARVTVGRKATEEEVTVDIQVNKGPRGERTVLRFEGNEILSDKELAAVLPEPTEPRFFEDIEGNASPLWNALRVRYASEGHLQISVLPVVAEYDKETREYLVTIPIDEGTLSLVKDVSLPPGMTDLAGPKGPDLQMKAGEPFRIDQYLHDRSALTQYYREQGFVQPRVTGILKPTEDKVAVIFTVANTSRPRVGNIRVARPGRTREAALRSLLTLKEGDRILPAELDRSRKRLFDTRVFKSVDIQAVESPENPGSRDLVIDLIEKKDVEFNYGLRYAIEGPSYGQSSDSGNYSALEVGGRLQFQNIFGNTNRFGGSGYLFGKQQSARIFFESETFFSLPVPTQVYVSNEENRELEISGLEERIRKIAFQQYYRLGETFQGSRWADRLRFQWNYSYRQIRLNPFDSDLEPVDTDRGSISVSLIGDTRDNFINPAAGAFWSISSEFSRTWLGSDVNFSKLYGQGFLYVSLAKNVIWVSGLRLGVVPGENPLLIIEDRFKAGGPSTVRGFALNSLGPKNEKGEPLGGQALAVFNQELRFPLYRTLHWGVFYDTGSVFLLASKMSLSGLRHCAGAGLRYLLPFGPIRFDWAYVLDPEPGEKRYRFVFSLGHAF